MRSHVNPRSAPIRWLDRAFRGVWTALCFALFGLGAAVLGTLIMPLIGLFVWSAEARERIARWWITVGLRAFIAIMDWVGLDYEVQGLHRAPARGGLIIANHPSLIDVVFLLALFPGADCVVKRALWSNPFTMLIVRFARYIPNDDTETMLATAVDRLRSGRRLILFPEGTRTVPGQPLDFKRGAAVVALKAGADVVPVRIDVSPTTLTKAEPWYAIPERLVQLSFRVLPPMPVDAVPNAGPGLRKASRELTARLQKLLSGAVATTAGTE